MDGELLADVVARETDPAANARHFARMGAIMAAVHNQATGWTPPAGFQRHALDANGLMGAEPFWGPFWDHPILSPAERDMMLGWRDRLHAALTRYGKPARTFSLIHADLHPRNVVIDGARAALIDFDDAGFGWHQYDLAVALVAYQEHSNFAMFRDACIAGYRSVRTISDVDLALLPMFLLIRDMAQMGWYAPAPGTEAATNRAAAAQGAHPIQSGGLRTADLRRRCFPWPRPSRAPPPSRHPDHHSPRHASPARSTTAARPAAIITQPRPQRTRWPRPIGNCSRPASQSRPLPRQSRTGLAPHWIASFVATVP